jgi:methionyl-tRNA synthetase
MVQYRFHIFGRTTTKLQTDITLNIFLKLNHNGFLKERMATQLYIINSKIYQRANV